MEAVVAGALMTALTMSINIASDFSPYPHGRTKRDGEFSGEKFRDRLLIPAVQKAIRDESKVVINLDGVKAMGSSFSEEAFGGLIRKDVAPPNDVIKAIEVRYTSPWLRPIADSIRSYMDEAATG